MTDSISLEEDSDQGIIDRKANKRNFLLTLINGIFASAGFRFVDSSMVLAAFVKQLTKSNVMVGLISSTMSAGWMWPQLIMSNILEHRPKKMPFYTLGASIRLGSWALITLLTFLIGDSRHLFLFICFYMLYFASNSSLGISGLPFNDIVAKSIPSNRIARLFSLRQFMGEILGIGVGILIRFILSEKSSLAFPHNYALIFTLSFIMMTISCVAFIMVKEPIEPVLAKRRPFWQHLKKGAQYLKTDSNYRAFLTFRVISSLSGMSIPFYIPYAMDKLNIHASTIGTFTAVGAISTLVSNMVWGYIGERKGSRYLMIVACSIACIAPITAFGVRYIPIGAQVTFYLLVFVANQTTLSGFNIAYMTYTLNMAPSMSRPTYIGFMNTLMFPMSFVPLLTGMLLRVMPYQVLFILSACLSLLGIYFARRLEDVEGLSDNVKKG